MATVADDIKNKALLHTGSTTVDDFTTDESQKALVCNALYEPLKLKLLSLRSWTFAFKRVALTGKIDLTGEAYLYSFDIPADLINLLTIYYAKDSRVAVFDYKIREGKIFTNVPMPYVEYIYSTDDDNLTPIFKDFFSYALAEEISFSLTGDKVLQDRLHLKAWGLPSDNLKGGYFAFASLTDQKQQPTKIIQDSPLLDARNEGVK
ncbi:MAG TPA: hypothetical protein VMW66_02280 [Elusimicrobiales bacterium]|nr:hypothetical protein [Elusimicrobiales bacterium]